MAAASAPTDDGERVMSGYLTKQGGSYRNWKKRHFVLKGTTLFYYKTEDESTPKGHIDLTTGRGVRSKKHCSGLEWPKDAKAAVSFGVATETRTYYLYGTSKEDVRKWMVEIQNVIKKHGKPNFEWEKDPEGKPEGAASKIVRGAAKVTTKVTKLIVKESGLVDEDTAAIIEGVADGIENQADAGRDASITDRLKMAVGDTAGVVGDAVDNEYVSTAANVVQEQAEADDDTTLIQRAGLAAGTALQGTSGLVDNEVGAAIMNTAGGIIHDQAEADADTSLAQRAAIAVGSTAAGVGEALEGDEVAVAITQVVEKAAEKAGEVISEMEESEKEEEEDEEED